METVKVPYLAETNSVFKQVESIWTWCDHMDIQVKVMFYGIDFSEWHIPDEEQRLLFILKWGEL